MDMSIKFKCYNTAEMAVLLSRLAAATQVSEAPMLTYTQETALPAINVEASSAPVEPAAPVVVADVAVSATVTDIKAKRTRKAKAEVAPPVDPELNGDDTRAFTAAEQAAVAEAIAAANAKQDEITTMVLTDNGTAPAAPAAATTLDEMRNALKAYSERTSIKAAMGLVQRYGGTRLSDILEDRWSEFVKECATAGNAEQALPGAGVAA